MTAGLGIPRRGFVAQADDNAEVASPTALVEAQRERWDPRQFGEEQIRGLVRRVFFPGWPQPARQVVFSAASASIDIASLCRKTGDLLAAEGAGKVCLVEANFQTKALEQIFGRTSNDGGDSWDAAGAVRKSFHQVAKNLWLVPASTFLGSHERLNSAPWLRSRLVGLRREFDYAVIHACTAAQSEAATLLAHLSDGFVLALEAHRTRRLTAMKIRQQLLAANVRLLGVVLCDRTFPIPERLYRRL